MRQIAKSLARPLGPVLLALLLQQPWAFDGARAQEQASTAASKTSRLSPALPVSLEQALYLIRSTLLTLNDANRSGNYTVLHDLAAPDFQAQNSAADLGQSFSDLRHRNFDLYGVALLAPQFTEAPALDQNGLLRLAGYFPTRPQQIKFDLVFQVASGQWRLLAISVATPEAPQAEVAQQQAQPKHEKQSK